MCAGPSTPSIWQRILAWSGRAVPSVSGPVHLGRNRIYILPTRAGLAFFVMLAVMLLISINYNNPPGYLLTFLLAGAGFVSIFHTHRTLHGLLVSPGTATPVFAGNSARFQVLLRNPHSAPRRAVKTAWSRTGDGPVQDIAGQDQARFVLSWPTTARGRFAARPVTISSVFPLGLCRAWSVARLAMSCTVYPRPEKAGPPWNPAGAKNAESARQEGAMGRTGQDGDDFSGLRSYRHGDPPRQVAWKATARSEVMVSKEFAADSDDAPVWLRWEDADLGDVEATLSRLCRWVLEADALGRPYGLVLPGQRIDPAIGPGHATSCLTALALFRADQFPE